MNRFSAISLAVLCLALPASAHLAKWVIPPTLDSLSVMVDDKVLMSKVGGTTILWDMDGRKLYSTDNLLMPFCENVATVIDRDNNTIVGCVDLDGNFTSLPSLTPAYDDPFFHDGMLVCATPYGNAYYRTDGFPPELPFNVKSYPFNKGYAPCLMYSQPEKKKGLHYEYYDHEGTLSCYTVETDDGYKVVDPKDILFLSGISDDGRGVGVIKNKFYWFDASDGIFKPILRGDDKSMKKRHLALDGDYEEFLLNLPEDSVHIRAKYGNRNSALLTFDKELKPVSITFDEGEPITFNVAIPSAKNYQTSLAKTGRPGSYGLTYNSENALPGQFDEVALLYGNRAFVQKHGKWGIVEILPGLDITLIMNQGDNIPFRHQKFETQIRVDLPANVSADNVILDIPAESGCEVDMRSRVTKNTDFGNLVTFDCTLAIPDSLPDVLTELIYRPFSIEIDGIDYFDREMAVKAWHRKSYNVDPIDTGVTIDNGVASFEINLLIDRQQGERDYSFQISLQADSIQADYKKISETRYKCTVYNLQEGVNNLYIYVTEEGCPSSVFPFEIDYTKPAPKKKEREAVVIRKKTPVEPKKEDNPLIKMEL